LGLAEKVRSCLQKSGLKFSEVRDDSFMLLFPIEGGVALTLVACGGKNVEIYTARRPPLRSEGAEDDRWLLAKNGTMSFAKFAVDEDGEVITCAEIGEAWVNEESVRTSILATVVMLNEYAERRS